MPNGNLGTLAKNSLADMVIIDGNPLDDITVLQNHQKLTTVKDGIVYKDLNNANPYLLRPVG